MNINEKIVNVQYIKSFGACKQGLKNYIEVLGSNGSEDILEIIEAEGILWEYKRWLLVHRQQSFLPKEIVRGFFLFCGKRLVELNPEYKEHYQKATIKTLPYYNINFAEEIVKEVQDVEKEELLQKETLKDFILNGVPSEYLHKGKACLKI